MTDQTLPATGGSYVRQKDGTLTREEEPAAARVEVPVEEAVKPAMTRTGKEA